MKSPVKILDKALSDGLLEMAAKSQKKRAFYSYHQPDEDLQRMVYAGYSETYVRPHRHQSPVKIEVYLIVQGQASLLVYDDSGKITETVNLDEAGPVRLVEIPTGVWHSLVITSETAVLYEIIHGMFDPFTFKAFAGWAPEEDDRAGGQEYLRQLKHEIVRQQK
jgi:cupin fold WbuC family metalloprotein